MTPRALETAEIPGIVADYAHAAACARRAGFDGVEVHAANAYLLDQFLRSSTNHRTDQYGGSVENRARLVLEVVEAVTKVWEGGARVGIRLSPLTPQVGSTPLDAHPDVTYGYVIDQLNRFGLAYLHLIEGETQGPRDEKLGIRYADLRRRFNGLYMANNGYDAGLATQARAEDRADLVCFGRAFIGNPDLVDRLRRGVALVESDKATWYGGDGHGYTDYPAAA